MASTARPLPRTPIRTGPPSIRRVASTVVVAHAASAVVGAGTWVVAARGLPASAVGVGVALTGLLTWCGLLANAGLGSAVVALTPEMDAAAAATMARRAMTRAATLGAGAGALAVVALPLVDGPLAAAGGRPVVAAALVLGAGATSAAVVGDAAAVAAGRAGLVVRRALLFAGLRLGLLGLGVGLDLDGRDVLVAGWAAAMAVAAVGQLAALDRRAPTARPVAASRVRFGAEAWGNHLVSVAAQSPALLLPVVLATVATPDAAGAFGAAWQVAGIAALASPAMATAVFAHADRDPAALIATARRSARDLLVVLVPVVGIIVLLGPLALGVLGSGYRAAGATALVLVAVALVPDAVSNLAVATWRARRHYTPAVVINTATAAIALGGTALLGPTRGASGAGAAWLGAQGLGAAVVLGGVARSRRRM